MTSPNLSIKHSTIKKEGSCNFCNRGQLSESGDSLVFPYTQVVKVTRREGSGIAVVICDNCLDELIKACIP